MQHRWDCDEEEHADRERNDEHLQEVLLKSVKEGLIGRGRGQGGPIQKSVALIISKLTRETDQTYEYTMFGCFVSRSQATTKVSKRAG